MIKHYQNTIISLLESLKIVQSEPFEHKLLVLEIQERLIKIISRLERKIQFSKRKIKGLKNLLSNKDYQLRKEIATEYKHEIELHNSKIEKYRYLIALMKTIGDSIVFLYIDRFDLKPLSFKETAGFITNKKGSRLERKCFRFVFKNGGIAILNDITNCLRYYDMIIIQDYNIWYSFEFKSGKNTTVRDLRQIENYSKINDYIFKDKQADIFNKGYKSTRIDVNTKLHNHIYELNAMIKKSYSEGLIIKEIENGLYYLINYKNSISESELYKFLNSLDLLAPIPFSVNQFAINESAFYPLCLSFEKPQYFIDLITGQLEILMFLDLKKIERQFINENYFFRIINDDVDFVIEMNCVLQNEPFKLKIGKFLLNRMFFEFLNTDFLIQTINDNVNHAQATLGNNSQN